MPALYRDTKEMMSYVVATDQCKSVRQFCEEVYDRLGFTDLHWEGKDENEMLIGKLPSNQILNETLVLVQIDPELFRPGEVPYLRGDATKIKNELGWQSRTSCS